MKPTESCEPPISVCSGNTPVRLSEEDELAFTVSHHLVFHRLTNFPPQIEGAEDFS